MSDKLKHLILLHRHAATEPTPSATESQQESNIDHPTRNSGCRTRSRTNSRDVSITEHSESEKSLKIVVIEDTEGRAPNLLLNCHDRVGRSEIYIYAAIGLILQLGAVVYFGFITYYKPIRDTFLKDDKRVVKYAFPCAAVGTLLLVLGLFICSWVVGKSTKETCYEAENHQLYVVWLQKDHTVSDQVFKPFAVYPASKRECITMSRRNIKHRENEIKNLIRNVLKRLFNYERREDKMGDDNDKHPTEVSNDNDELTTEVGNDNKTFTTKVDNHPLYWPLKSITFIGALISLIGFISQFIGMRGLNWTASIVQLGITILVTILRVIVRRGLGKSPAHTSLTSKFELDWFVLSFGDLDTAPWYTSKDFDKQKKDSKHKTCLKWEIYTGAELTYPPLKKALDTDCNKSIEDSELHKIILVRKHLAELSEWKSPVLDEAIHLSRAIEAVASKFLRTHSDELPDELPTVYEWSIPAIFESETIIDSTTSIINKFIKDNVYIKITKDEDGKWFVNEAEIEAILSLWLYSASSTDLPRTSRTQSLRVYGPSDSEKRLIRDLEWWMPQKIPQLLKHTENELAELRKKRERTIVGSPTKRGNVVESSNTTIHTVDDNREYLVLECNNERKKLFSRHLLFSFIRAIAKMLRVGVGSVSNEYLLTYIKMDSQWTKMRFRDEDISELAITLEKIGFGALSDIYVDLLLPLSLEQKLTNVENIIEEAMRQAIKYEQSRQWKNLVDTCVCLLDLALHFDLEKEVSASLAIAKCLGFIYRLNHEAWLQEKENRMEGEMKEALEALKNKLNDEKFKFSIYISTILNLEIFTDGQHHLTFSPSVMVDMKHKNENFTSFPDSFQITDAHLEVIDKCALKQTLHIEDFKRFEKADVFGLSPLHYAVSFPMLEVVIDDNRQTSDGFLNLQDFMGWTPLHYACLFGNEAMVKCLILHDTPIEIAGKDGISPTHCAVQSGKIEILQIIIGAVNASTEKSKSHMDRNQRQPIHWAAIKGNVEMVRLMKDDISLTDRFGWTALHLASIYKHKFLLQYIIEYHAKIINTADKELRTLLHLAVENESKDVVQILLRADAKVNTTAKNATTPLHVAAKQNNQQILSMLLEYGANKEAMDKKGRTPLYLSVENGQIKTIAMLVNAGANIAAATEDGTTPLHVALSRGQDGLEIVKILLEAGADTRAQDGATVLHIAAQCGSLMEILNLLGPVKLELDAIDEKGQTALLIAIYGADWKAAKKLLDMNASVNADKRNGYTPLLGAVLGGNEDISRQLLSMGANVNDAYQDGFSVLHHAILHRSQKITSLLLEAGAKINAVTRMRNETPLHIAVREGHSEIVQTLLEKGADMLSLNLRGFSPLQHALYNGDLSIVRVLIEYVRKSTVKAALQPNKEGDTPLHTLAACTNNEDTICEMLDELLSISSEIDINARNMEGRTPLDVACFGASDRFIVKLMEKGAKLG